MLVVETDSGSVLGIVERERAYSTVHEGAIYLHLGEPYLVSELDLAAGAALVEPFSGDWYTQAKKDTTTAIEEPLLVREHAGVELSFGRVSVTEHVVAYQRKSTRDGAVLETVALDLPAGDVRDGGRVVRAAAVGAGRLWRRCRSCSARCTPPSTR